MEKIKKILPYALSAVIVAALVFIIIIFSGKSKKITTDSTEQTDIPAAETTECQPGTTGTAEQSVSSDLRTSELTETDISSDISETLPDSTFSETSDTPDETTKKPRETTEKAKSEPFIDGEYEYFCDISGYLKYICPENAEEYLILVNRQNPLGNDYVPPDLVNAYGSYKMREAAAMALEAMRKDMKANGITMKANNCYRSYATQKTLYNRYLTKQRLSYPSWTEEQVVAKVQTFSAPPGTSEHQTGLAIDFAPVSNYFKSNKMYPYLVENAYKFGFILRYDNNTIKITGYKYEPWHWRFVGRDAATYIHEHGNMTLEEYYFTVLHPDRISEFTTYPPSTDPPPDTVSDTVTESVPDTADTVVPPDTQNDPPSTAEDTSAEPAETDTSPSISTNENSNTGD